jgi:peptidoglycan hydrolase-like protein with peptidoglycan-binding domain
MAIKTYKRGDTTQLSKNFTATEFDCEGSGCCKETVIDDKLVEILQKIRDHFGKPIGGSHLTAYRCPTHNAKVDNAAKASFHTKGMAADISIEGVAPAEIAKYAESIGVLGIGLYDTFVHIDTRDYKSFWCGHQQEYRSTFGGAPVYTKEQFIRELQEAIGAGVDGIAGPETLSKTPTISASVNATHPAVKPVQKWLYAKGCAEVGEADGVAGPKFTSALAHFQQENDCTPTGLAEEWGKTWQKLLGLK